MTVEDTVLLRMLTSDSEMLMRYSRNFLEARIHLRPYLEIKTHIRLSLAMKIHFKWYLPVQVYNTTL